MSAASSIGVETLTSQSAVKDVAISLLDTSDLGNLTETIRNCRATVENVEVRTSRQQPHWGSNEVHRLFDTIGALPNLQTIQFKFLGMGDHDNSFPLSLFTHLLSRQPWQSQLKSLRFILVGPIECNQENDLQDFCRVLRNLMQLEEFILSACSFSHDWLSSSSSGASLSPLLTTLAQLPALQKVTLKATTRGHLGHFEAPVLGTLCDSSIALKSLSIDNFTLGNEHVAALAHCMASNSTVLEEVYLNLSTTVTDLDPRQFPAALETNRSLCKLQIRLAKHKTLDLFLENTAQALCQNNTLVDFAVHGAMMKHNDTVEESFAGMLESNCTLQRLVLPYCASWRPKIDMLLGFNTSLRFNNMSDRKCHRSCPETISQQEWIDLFVDKDICFLYYYLRYICPLLCNERSASPMPMDI
ncbi:expressed unknown protein [Seminavis robusta]|uniref:Uncharacterized protein n=1 Tax=Seminavis robusta TaxID=568900 RepID=A0A9N8EAA3_9STRA|nr:expressed unknown protein [Seminavis robusta]|eukprot:Sro720_g192650.1 n/a (415) ;mRNA; r:36021-37265